MRISDWSSDVCSSDLLAAVLGGMTDIALIERVAKIEIVRKNDQLAAFLRPEIDRPSRCGKAAIDGWMRILIATGRDADLAHDTVGILALAIFRIGRSEEHTSELQSLMRISYAVFCLKKKRL